ncbi:MAG: hypothetical protein ACQSGP_05160 [Frankia sp.]
MTKRNDVLGDRLVIRATFGIRRVRRPAYRLTLSYLSRTMEITSIGRSPRHSDDPPNQHDAEPDTIGTELTHDHDSPGTGRSLH